MLVSIFAGVVAFVLTVVGIPVFIRFYHKAHITGQQMHEDVKQHQAKAGTPTMGGIVFLITGVLVSLVLALATNQLTNNAGMILFILVLYGLVGFFDDFLKVFRKINEGLNPKQKFLLQLIGGVIFFLLMYIFSYKQKYKRIIMDKKYKDKSNFIAIILPILVFLLFNGLWIFRILQN